MGGIVSAVLDPFTGASGVRRAGEQAAAQQRQAGIDAANVSAFRPVGMTTRFGTSQFTREIDPATGVPYISAASYTPAGELSALQNRLFGRFGDALSLAEQQQLAAAPLGAGAQRLFGLSEAILPTSVARAPSAEALDLAAQYRQAAAGLAPTTYTPTAAPEAISYANQLRTLAGQVTPTSYDPTAAAQQYFQQQQALLQPSREAQLSGIQSGLFARGRGGLGVRTGTGGAPTSPELQAYYNALAQQDAQLAAQSTDVARARLAQDIGLGTQLGGQALATQTQAEQLARQNMLQNLGTSLDFRQRAYGTSASAEDLARQRFMQDVGLGSGLFGTAGSLLGQQAGLISGAYAPLQTQLGLSGQVEQMSMQPYQLGIQLGQAQQPGQTAGAQTLYGGAVAGAQTQYGANLAAQQMNNQFLSSLIGSSVGALGAPGGGTQALPVSSTTGYSTGMGGFGGNPLFRL